MEIQLLLKLPRDRMTVRLARRLCRGALAEIGVAEACVSDLEIALSEACSNVLDHAIDGEQYAVEVAIDEDSCSIRVVDQGPGFDPPQTLSRDALDPHAERGRGLVVMDALVDHLAFVDVGDGLAVEFEKQLTFDRAGIVTSWG